MGALEDFPYIGDHRVAMALNQIIDIIQGNNIELGGTFTPEQYGAAGDGTTNDTAAIQAAIDAATAAKGRVLLGAKTYAFTHLDVNGSCDIVGTGTTGVYGTFASGVGNFTPLVAPFLTGTVLKCTANGQAAAIDLVGESTAVNLRDFGLLWATPFASTGHGIRASPGAGKNGLAGPRWDNVQVWGHDGNSYAFHLTNAAQGTFTHLRAWGGGLLRFIQDGGSQYGNSTFIGCMVKLLAAGTAHGTHLSSTGSVWTRMAFIGCEWNAVNGRSYAALLGYTFTNPTSAQRLFVCAADSTLRGLSFISPAFDNGGSAVAAPQFPRATAGGGVFLDPGGWYQIAPADYPFTSGAMIEAPTSLGGKLELFRDEYAVTSTSSVTLAANSTSRVRLVNATSGAATVTLPDAAAANGKVITVKKIDASANAVTVTGVSGQLIDGAATSALAAQWSFITVLSTFSGWTIIGKG